MIVGITVNEYIRNRKLSMAAEELMMSDKKVIDIALKYGYESPESFAKAFSKFHGVTPNLAKRSGNTLQSFNRLVIKIVLEGGTVMEYKILEKEAFKLLAKVKSFRNETISEEGNTEIPDFWKECELNGVFDSLNSHTTNHSIYGVCAPISKESTHFDYGIATPYVGGVIPEGFRIWEVNPNVWAIFKCIGTNGDCIAQTWDRIFKEFLPSSNYSMIDDTDFELYQEGLDCFCEIWIPVIKNSMITTI